MTFDQKKLDNLVLKVEASIAEILMLGGHWVEWAEQCRLELNEACEYLIKYGKYFQASQLMADSLAKLNQAIVDHRLTCLEHGANEHWRAPTIKIKKLRPWAKLPVKASEGAACFDIHYCSEYDPKENPPERDEIFIMPDESLKLPTGLAFEIPTGWEMQVRPRSGLANNRNLIVPNSPGTIDSDYRGEVIVGLRNIGQKPQSIFAGHRIAQITFRRVPEVIMQEVDELSETERGAGGFGSTGVK